MSPNELFEKNEVFAYFVLHRYFPTIESDEDIKQCALLGLWKACKTYNESKSKFTTYAYRCISNEVCFQLRKDKKHYEVLSLNTVTIRNTDGQKDLHIEDIISYEENKTLHVEIDKVFSQFKDRDIEIYKLNLQGYNQTEIGNKFGMSQAHVSRLIQKINNAMKESIGG